MSLAASPERCASVRTSEATTAKPLPASPARAASTAALSASRLVWKAMSSITRMMSEIFCEAVSMRAMASTAWPAMAPPDWAAFIASSAISVAWRAAWAEALTEAASSSVVAAVSSSEEACSSVRLERSSAPMLISRAAVPTSAEVVWIVATVSESRSTVSLMAPLRSAKRPR
ncbi:hypothetical protein D3C87_1567090 [compost metagenome]